MLKALVGSTLYLNVRTNTVVAALDRDDRQFSIATVTEDGFGRRRTVRAASFHEDYLASDGQPHTFGYVPLASLPEGHPHAEKKTDRSDMDLIDMDNLDELSDTQLAALILQQEVIKRHATEVAERAKAIAKYRRGDSLGLDIQGDIALVYTSGSKFDAGTAKRNLSAEDFKRILLPKPDATMARKLFENEPEKLDACLKDNGPSLTVRQATDEDRAKFSASRPTSRGDEDYSFQV
jgi:hypothetical protein